VNGRWLVLIGYALLVASTQLLWITFAPITNETAKALNTSVENVGWLSAIFQFVYIILALPAGRFLDSRFSWALGAGATVTALGSLLRLIDPGSFGLQLAAQGIIAIGQPLVLNALTKIVSLHFPANEQATAISVGSASIFVGILLATFSGPLLFNSGGLSLVFVVQAGFAVLSALWVLLILRVPPRSDTLETREDLSLGWLRSDHLMWTLGALLFIGFGVFISLSTWLEAILKFFGVGSVESGNLLAIMTFGGIIGSAVLPPLVAARDQRRSLLFAALGVAGLALVALAIRHDALWLGATLFIAGFFIISTLPVLLDWSDRHVGVGRQGAAVGFLMLAGNAGGLVLVLILQALIGGPYAPLIALGVALIAGLGVTMGLPARVNDSLGEREIAAIP
jgi:predicted MFS family arabinose efflux permease